MVTRNCGETEQAGDREGEGSRSFRQARIIYLVPLLLPPVIKVHNLVIFASRVTSQLMLGDLGKQEIR